MNQEQLEAKIEELGGYDVGEIGEEGEDLIEDLLISTDVAILTQWIQKHTDVSIPVYDLEPMTINEVFAKL